MEIQDILNIAAACVVSAGGVGGVMLAVIKLATNNITETLSKKYELKLQKEMQEYKASIEKKTFVSKTRLDTEFSLYRELSNKFCVMVKEVSIMIPAGAQFFYSDKNQQRKSEEEQLGRAEKAIVNAQDTLYSNVAFISEDISNDFENILDLCKEQRYTFLYKLKTTDAYVSGKFEKEDYNKTNEINKEWRKLTAKIREYIRSLEEIKIE